MISKDGMDPGSGSTGIFAEDDGEWSRLLPRRDNRDRYELRDELGRGGMGVVYKVWDRELNRELAMKVLLGTEDADIAEKAKVRGVGRFIEEAQIAAQLDHPGIVPIHDIGHDRHGRVYFTMKLVKGRTLAEIFAAVRDGEVPRSRALEILLRVGEAVAFAHSHEVIHRDLKPQNVMVGSFGEAYVMDWGLARLLGVEESPLRTVRSEVRVKSPDSPLLTDAGAQMGTPSYMSPEQARGETDRIGPASDIYAFGAMLYEWLSGRGPYDDRSEPRDARTLMVEVARRAPRPLHQMSKDLPPELEAITEKAMARSIEDRYASMGDLVEDLRAFVEGRVVQAHRTGAWTEFKKWVGRNRVTATTVGTSLLVLVLGSVVFSLITREKSREVSEAYGKLETSYEEIRRTNEQLSLAEAQASDNLASAEILIDMLSYSDPEFSRGEEFTVTEVLLHASDKLRERDVGSRRMRASLAHMLGQLLYHNGEWVRARELVREAYEIRREDLGPPDMSYLSSASLYGAILLELERYEDAEVLFREIYDVCDEFLPEADPRTMSAMGNLAIVMSGLGEIEDARDLLEEALSIHESVAPEGVSPSTALRINYASILLRFDEAVEAYELVKETFEDNESRLGSSHPETLSAAANFASLLQMQGDGPRALAFCERWRPKTIEVFGPLHPDSILITLAHSQALSMTGRFKRAENVARTLENLETRITVGHRFHVGWLNATAYAVASQKRFGEALPLFREAWSLIVQRGQQKELRSITVARHLAELAAWNGEFDLAEELIGHVLSHTPVDHPERAERMLLKTQIQEVRVLRQPGAKR